MGQSLPLGPQFFSSTVLMAPARVKNKSLGLKDDPNLLSVDREF